LGKASNQTIKALGKIKGKGLGTMPQKRPHHKYLVGSKSPQTSWAIFILRWEDQLAVLCAKANKLFMRTVQQNVFLILNRVPVTFVTNPELIRPSNPVMTHSLDQKVMARKAKARLKYVFD
jgi:superoxide dismutase